jgi:hypothetical protein
MASPSAVKAAASAAVEAATAVVRSGNIAVSAATRVATVITAAGVSACRAAAIASAIHWAIAITVARSAISITWPVTIPGSISITGATIIAVSVIAAVIPRASADEHAAYKPVRSVIAIRRAGVGIISVIAIRADGSCTDARIHWADADAHGNLRVCGPRRKQQNPQQCCIF